MQKKSVGKLTRLRGGSGESKETVFGSSLTLTEGVSISFPFPLSRLVPLGLPTLPVKLPSLMFCKELEREIDGSSSTTMVTRSESMDIGRVAGSIGISATAGGSGADVAPF